MKILVTGASGLVGGNLVRHLHSLADYEIRVLVRENSNTAAVDGLDVERVFGDIRDAGAMQKAVSGCDGLVHAAALVSQWRPNRALMEQVNIQGTVNVMQAALDAGVSRAVHVSTVDTLGLSSLDKPADETAPHESMAAFNDPYTDTKYESEQQAKRIAAKGLDLVIVKPTYMLGEWDVRPTSGKMVIEVAGGKAVAYTGGGNNFVDVLDVCEGIRLALHKGRTGEAYILANAAGNLTYEKMWTIIAEVVGVKPPRFKIPYPVALAAGYLMDAAGRISGKEPDVHSVLVRLSYAPHYFTPTKAIQELGLPQSPIEGAVERAYKWFMERGML